MCDSKHTCTNWSNQVSIQCSLSVFVSLCGGTVLPQYFLAFLIIVVGTLPITCTLSCLVTARLHHIEDLGRSYFMQTLGGAAISWLRWIGIMVPLACHTFCSGFLCITLLAQDLVVLGNGHMILWYTDIKALEGNLVGRTKKSNGGQTSEKLKKLSLESLKMECWDLAGLTIIMLGLYSVLIDKIDCFKFCMCFAWVCMKFKLL